MHTYFSFHHVCIIYVYIYKFVLGQPIFGDEVMQKGDRGRAAAKYS